MSSKSSSERGKEFRKKQLEENEDDYREKNSSKCKKYREEQQKQLELPPPTFWLAMSRNRGERLKQRYPELYEEGYFCYTLDCEKCDAAGLLDDRMVCKYCKEKHWKREWPIKKEWRF